MKKYQSSLSANSIWLPANQIAVTLISLTAMGLGGWILLCHIFFFANTSLPLANTMATNTALGFILAGLALFFLLNQAVFKQPQTNVRASLLCAGSVVTLGLVAFLEYLVEYDLAIQTPFTHDWAATFSEQMAPLAALNFTLLGGILILRQWRPHVEQKISEAVAAVILAHSGLALLSYLFSTEALYHLSFYTSMDVLSAFLFILLAFGLLMTAPQPNVKVLHYGLTLAAVALAFKIYLMISDWAGASLPIFVSFYPVIILASLLAGIGPGLFALMLSAFVVIIWIFEPIGFFVINTFVNQVALFLFLVNGLLINGVVHFYRLNRQKVMAYDRAQAVIKSAELRDSETRYRSLFEHMLEGFAYCQMLFDEQGHPQDFVYLSVNKAFESLTGLKDVIGKRVTQIIPQIKELNPELLDIYGRVASTGIPEKFEIDFQPLGLYLSISVYSPEKNCFVAVFDNITERKRIEDALRASERRFRGIFNHQFQFSALLTPDGTIIEISDSVTRDTGVKSAELIGKPFLDCPWWRDLSETQALWRRLFAESLTQPVPSHGEVVFLAGDGSQHHTLNTVTAVRNEQGEVEFLIAEGIDITERKQAEKALRQNERTFAELIELSPFGMYVVDSQFRIAMMNTKSQSGAFCNVRPVIGRDFAEAIRILWPEDLAAEILSHFRNTLDSGEPYYSPRFVNPRHDLGNVESYEWELHRMTLPDGQLGVICYYYDSTELRAAESALRQSEERLKLFIEHAPAGIAMFDQDMRYLAASRRWRDDYGLNEEVIGRSHYELWPEISEQWRAVHRQGLAGEVITADEDPFVRKDGSIQWLKWEVRPWYQTDVRIGGILIGSEEITARKKFEEALREREERYELIVTGAEAAIWDWDVLNKKVLYSPRWKQLRGLSDDEISDHEDEWQKGLHPEDMARVMSALKAHFEGQTPYFSEEYRVRHKDGHWVWVMDRGMVRRDVDGRVIRMAGSETDITERKLAEAQIRSDAERLAALLDAQRLIASAKLDRSALLQLILDTLMRLTGAEGGSLEMVDDEEMVYESATGLAKAFTGLRLKAKDSLSGLCVATGQLQRSDDTETDPRVERAACRRIGLRSMIMIPLRYGPDAFGVLKLMSSQVAAFNSKSEDTLRLMAEFVGATIARQIALNAVMVSEQRMDLAFRATQDGIWDWNMETDEVYYSSRWKAMLGYEENEIEPRFNTVKQLLHPDDLEPVSRHVEKVMRGDHDLNIEFRMRHKDGHYIDILSRGFPVRREPNGPIIRIVGTHFDLTERKHAEKALKEADRRKDEFLATLAHELRNPLTPISNGLHILQTPNIDNATRERIRLMMDRQVKHMVRLVDELMEISRITRGMIELRKEKIDLIEAINAAIETSQPLIDAAKHQIEINLPAEPLMVEADKLRLTQVIANLLNNAAKYTPENGQIWLTARREGAKAIVSLRDNGIGIAADMLPKVFNLFTQVGHQPHQMHSGLGIGLTLVHDLIKLHGGTVKANSEGLGQGSEFVVEMPLAKVTLEPPSGCQSPEQDSTTFNLPSQRVLVVDDNQDIAESHALILRQLGVEVTVAYSGPAALEAITTDRPSVVLLDIGMPGMDGYEVARRIRQLPEGQVIMLIAITGWGQEEDLRQSQKAGFNYHLVKPVDLTALKELLMTRPQERKAK